jgi:hypothetical protein
VDQVHVVLGQAVGLLAVANRREIAGLESRQVQEPEDPVRDREPVLGEVLGRQAPLPGTSLPLLLVEMGAPLANSSGLHE